MADNEERPDRAEVKPDAPAEENGQTDINEQDSELHSILYGGEYSEYGEDLGAEEEEPAPAKSRLKTFSGTGSEEQTGGKKLKTMTQKRIRLITVIAGVVIAAVVLILIFAPELFKGSTVDAPPVIYEGEVRDGSKRVLIFEHIERERIQKIDVKNEYGTYTAYYNNEVEAFTFEGLEGAPYNEELFAQLVVSAGYPLISDRLMPDDRADLSEYGLGPDDDPAYFVITTRESDGSEPRSYKLFIGKPSLTEDYYYCMLEGRDIVYVLEQSIKSTLLADVKTLINPILTYPISDNSYLTDINFVNVAHNNEWFIKINCQDDAEKAVTEEAYGVTVPYMVTYPFEYDASAAKMTTLLGQIVNMTGSELLEYGVFDVIKLYNDDGTPLLDENGDHDYEYVLKEGIGEKYGLAKPAYDIYYQYQDMDVIVSLSEKQYDEDGNAYYYALSLLYDTIARIDASSLTFLDWALMDYLDKPIFNVFIDKVAEIDLKTADKEFLFTLTGIDDDLVCVESKYTTRTVFKGKNTTDTSNDGIRNFRKFYQTILTIEREDFVEEPTEEDRALLCEMKVTFRNGTVKDYKFYSYSERRCFMTINDKGEFYVLRSMIKKLVNDAVRLMNYETVDPSSEY